MMTTQSITDVLTRLESIEQESTQLKQANTRIEQKYVQLAAQSKNERRRYRVQMGLALTAVAGALFLSPGNRAALAQAGTDLATRVAALEAKTQFMSADPVALTTTFTG